MRALRRGYADMLEVVRWKRLEYCLFLRSFLLIVRPQQISEKVHLPFSYGFCYN